MNSFELRQKFIEFFQNNGHEFVSSSSLIPAQDPTILFTNAGMNQFKDAFLGREQRSYKRAVSIQKCVRAGGKHNDLDNVGYTSRHLTFFEMMGNFSFGDYFKKEAIEFAWNFLTKTLKIESSKLYATVFESDDQAYDIWHITIGLPVERIYRLGAQDNFWQMGDTGPCGPCSEILIDRGSSFGCGADSCSPSCPCGERFLEIWNLVFMEFDRQADGTDKRLSQSGVDTGMGLERLCVVMQDVSNIYQTDLFTPIIKALEHMTSHVYNSSSDDIQVAFNVVAEHTRSATFLIADGCVPSNEARGYVLRKIIRRAALFAQKISDKPILAELSAHIIQLMHSVYPGLLSMKTTIEQTLATEVKQFFHNLVQGRTLLLNYCKRNSSNPIIDGATAFRLYDTHGFPLELINVIAKEQGYSVDQQAFESLMNQQRLRSGKKVQYSQTSALPSECITEFIGYEQITAHSSVQALIVNDQLVQHVLKDTECWLVAERTPFFAACGGQVSDQGTLIFEQTYSAQVLEVKRIHNAIALKLLAPCTVKLNQEFSQHVEHNHRWCTMKNHTATHLLQAALITLLGDQVRQCGSLVHPDYLRFDFNYAHQLTAQQIIDIERLVNQKIMENSTLVVSTMSYKDALAKGAMAIFGEKYNPESVRVVDVPGFSMELCGGTHVAATGEIGVFKITHVSALSAGQRRIVALTGTKALEFFQYNAAIVNDIAKNFKIKIDGVITTVVKQTKDLQQAHATIKNMKKDIWKVQIKNLLNTDSSSKLLCEYIADSTALELKEVAHYALEHHNDLCFFVSGDEHKLVYYAALPTNYTGSIDLDQFLYFLKNNCALSGGRKANTLQGGASAVSYQNLKDSVRRWYSQNNK